MESEWFYRADSSQDFPIRDRKVFLHIRRRRWLDENGQSVIVPLDYPIVAKGIKLSPQFAAFLKDTDGLAPQLGYYYRIDGGKLERAYKESLSNLRTWDQLDHCTDWVLLTKNMGEKLCIDETMLDKEIFTIISNSDTHGKSGAVIAIVQGTAIEVVSAILLTISV